METYIFGVYDICVEWKKFPLIYYRWESQKKNHFYKLRHFFAETLMIKLSVDNSDKVWYNKGNKISI